MFGFLSGIVYFVGRNFLEGEFFGIFDKRGKNGIKIV